jgi:hypothetical protein
MWRKTVVRRLLKYVPQNPLLAMVLAYEEGEVAQTDAEVMNALRPQDTAMSHRAVDRADEYAALSPGEGQGEVVAEHVADGQAEGPPREVIDMSTKPTGQQTEYPDPYAREGKGGKQPRAVNPADASREREPGEDDGEDDLDVDRKLADQERRQRRGGRGT